MVSDIHRQCQNGKQGQLTIYYDLRPPVTMSLRTQNFRAPGHQRLDFDDFIYIRYAAPPYSVCTVITASVDGR